MQTSPPDLAPADLELTEHQDLNTFGPLVPGGAGCQREEAANLGTPRLGDDKERWMDLLRTAGIFVAAAMGELGGTYAVWRWRRAGATPALIVVGVAALLAYAIIQTYQPVSRFSRVYAAYAGVFLVGAILWGWTVDGTTPDRFDLIGGATVLLGAAVILWGRSLFG